MIRRRNRELLKCAPRSVSSLEWRLHGCFFKIYILNYTLSYVLFYVNITFHKFNYRYIKKHCALGLLSFSILSLSCCLKHRYCHQRPWEQGSQHRNTRVMSGKVSPWGLCGAQRPYQFWTFCFCTSFTWKREKFYIILEFCYLYSQTWYEYTYIQDLPKDNLFRRKTTWFIHTHIDTYKHTHN